MIKASDLRELTNNNRKTKIPEDILNFMQETALKGECSVLLSPLNDFGVKCNTNSDIAKQHEELDKFTKVFERYGYTVHYVCPYSDPTREVDLVQVSW